jgi:hypothetical protein
MFNETKFDKQTHLLDASAGAFIVYVILMFCTPILIWIHESGHYVVAKLLHFEIRSFEATMAHAGVIVSGESIVSNPIGAFFFGIGGGVAECLFLLFLSKLFLRDGFRCIAIVPLFYAFGEAYGMYMIAIGQMLIRDTSCFAWLWWPGVFVAGVLVFIKFYQIEFYYT